MTTEEKWGKGGINRPIMRVNHKYSMCPIHIAIEGDHLVIAQAENVNCINFT